MNKENLAARIAEKTGFTQKDTKVFLKALTETIVEALQSGDSVHLQGMGTFELRDRASRTAYNPRTGEPIQVAAKQAPAFSACKSFKDKF